MTTSSFVAVDQSPEQIAFRLLELIARNENRVLHANEGAELEAGERGCDRAYILNTYAECLVAVRGDRVLP